MNLVTNLLKNHYLLLMHHMFFAYALYYSPILMIIFGIFGAVVVGHKIAHLYFGHKRYENNWLDKTLSIIYVCVLGQGSPMQLAYVHRMHHKYADTINDPHSPAHLGRLNVYFLNWKKAKIEISIIKDYRNSNFQKFLTKHFKKIHISFLLSIYLIFGIIGILFVSSIIFFNFHYSSITNTFSHQNNNAINNNMIKYLMPWGYKHKEHHDQS
jgi:fatty-acid desaturase